MRKRATKTAGIPVLLAGLAALAGTAKAGDLAVSEVRVAPGSVDKAKVVALAEAIRKAALGRDPDWNVLTRETMEQILKDMSQPLSCTDEECESEAAGDLPFEYLVLSDLTHGEGGWTLALKLYRGDGSGRQVATREIAGEKLETLADSAASAAGALFGEVAELLADAPAGRRLVGRFTSTPVGASVSVDGRNLCTSTPCSKALSAGSHRVAMAIEGRRSKEAWITLSGNGQTVDFRLVPVSTRMKIEALDESSGDDLVGEVSVGGEKLGETPFAGLVPVTAESVTVAVEGMGRRSVKVSLVEGREASAVVKFRSEEPVSARLAPVPRKDPNPMADIPAGCFQMGSSDGDDDEQPVHKVCLDAFRMDRYEVTRDQYVAAMGANPHEADGRCKVMDEDGDFSEGALQAAFKAAEIPQVCVDWTQADAYCHKVGKRLPSEAEWEYAARGGTTTRWSWGDSETDAGRYAWYEENSRNSIHPVGRKLPNGWGLYDMAGNVWEWTADWEGEYADTERRNPTGPEEGDERANRGGSWGSAASGIRPTYRDGDEPDVTYSLMGFRCADDK